MSQIQNALNTLTSQLTIKPDIDLDTTQIIAYREVLKDLNEVEMQRALSTSTLTEKQKEQILAYQMTAGSAWQVKFAEEGLNKQQLVELAMSQGLTQQDALELISKLNLSDAYNAQGVITKELVKEKIKLLHTQGKLIGQDYELAKATLLNEKSQKTLFATLASSPLTWIIAGTAALSAGLYYLSKQSERATKKLEDTKNALHDLQSESDDLQKQLDDINPRLKELERLEKTNGLDVGQKSELEALREQNAELERKIALKRTEIELNAKQGVREAHKAVTGKRRAGKHGLKSNEEGTELLTKDLDTYMKEQKEVQAQLDKLGKELHLGAISSDTLKTDDFEKLSAEDQSKIKRLVADYEAYNTSISETESSLATMIATEQEQIDYFDDLIECGVQLTFEQEKEYQKAKDLVDAYNNIYLAKELETKGYDDASAAAKRYKIISDALDPNKDGDYSDKKYTGDKEALQKYIDSLSDAQLAAYGSIDLPLRYNLTDLKKLVDDAVREAQKMARENPVELSFVEQLSSVQKLQEGFDQLDKIYADVLDKKEFDWSSILNNDGFTKVFGDLGNKSEEYKTTYNDFIKTIANSPQNIKACQGAFNDLATAYIDTSGVLSHLTEESKAAAIIELEQMGIMNAEEVVTAALTKQIYSLSSAKEIATLYGYDLDSITVDEINSLITEGTIAPQTGQALAYYALQKQLANGTVISTKADVENLENLAKAAGYDVEVLANLEVYKKRLSDPLFIKSKAMANDVDADIRSIFQKAEASVKKIKFELPEVKYNGGAATRTARENAKKDADKAKKDAEEAKKELKELLEAQLALYKAELESGRITLQEYLNKSKKLVDDYYKQGKISAKEYWDYQKQILENQKDVYDKVLSAVSDCLDKEIKKWQDKIDVIEKNNDALDKQLKKYDSALSAVQTVYDTEIKAVEKQKQDIQDTIDGLQDANDERERALALEKAQYELKRAQEQRVKKILTEDGFVYRADGDAIRDAQENLEKTELDNTINDLQKQQEALDDYIDKLNEFKDKWGDITNAWKTHQDEQNAIAIWGHNYQAVILQNNLTDVENFKNNYVHIQQEIDNNQGLIDSYNEKITYYNALKEQWNSISTEYENQINRQLAAQVLGANWETDILSGRLDVMNNFRNQYIGLQQAIADATWKSANEQIAAHNAVKAAEASAAQTPSNGSAGSVGNTSDTTASKPLKPYEIKPPKPLHTGGGGHTANHMARYGTGTDNAQEGYHEVSEDGDEIVRDNYGNAVLAKGHQLYLFEGGETVFNASETSELLKGKLIPLQLKDISSVLNSAMSPRFAMSNMATPNLNNLGSSSGKMVQQSVIQHITVTLPNITNETGFNNFAKEMNRLKLDAYQFSNQRHL